MTSTVRGSDNFSSSKPFITEQGSNANGHYRKWSNGFIEVMMRSGTVNAGATATLVYPIPLVSEVVNAQLSAQASGGSQTAAVNFESAPTLTDVVIRNTSGSSRDEVFVKVEGY